MNALPIKDFHFKNPRWRTADTLERPVLHHREILQFVDFQDGGCPSSWNFETEIFNSQSLQRHVLRYHITFCADRSTVIKFNFTNRVIPIWNSLSNRIVSADTVNCFLISSGLTKRYCICLLYTSPSPRD